MNQKKHTRPGDVGRAQPSTALHDGPIWAPDGSVLVDARACPTLYRAAQTGGQVIAAVRAKWAAVEDAMRHGHVDEADRLRAPLIGVEPSTREVVVPADLPADTQDLIEQLKKAPDKRTASKLRAELRERGIKGGLRGLRQ